ncbi:MAG: hypothetical protein VX044_03055, partial [Planctomycetota bacterium]|nr:hypothetical protein [Planctomycetota bacterium]
MNKSYVLMTLLAALALAGGWFLLGSGGVVAPPAPPAAAEERGATADAEYDVGVAVEVAESAWQADEDEDLDDEPERSELELAVAPAPKLVIQVWDRKRGRAADSADVFVYFDYDGPDYRDPFQPHLCELAIAEGRRFKATSDGRVELPRLHERALVAAQLPGVVGFRILDERHGAEESVTLRADETVTVRVLDEDGQPAADV